MQEDTSSAALPEEFQSLQSMDAPSKARHEKTRRNLQELLLYYQVEQVRLENEILRHTLNEIKQADKIFPPSQ